MKNSIQVPDRLLSILEASQPLHGAVMLTLDAFEPWLRLSGMPFFPEYTDHGPQHVCETLVTAGALIRDEAYATLTAADVAALVLSVLVHDSAMHLDERAFLILVTDGHPSHAIEGFVDVPWSVLWREFLGEASRFDGRKLTALFGDAEPIHRPPTDPSHMTRRDRLLIGEFLRRHHHRLAHEIACFGAPSDGPDRLRFLEVPGYVSEVAGVTARSHGVPIRQCVDILHKADHQREYRGMHPAFLMGVLRIADYLQMAETRAPKELLRIKLLQSPVSHREWDANAAIRDVRHTHEDPEALFIEAEPADVLTYLRIQDWLAGVQKELDESWAVLGEVYGRYAPLDGLGLVVRRVRSNLDNVTEFARRIKYIPCRASFQAANPDLLKLLVGPLYGDDAEIAFRELVQNAVDAVREIRMYVADNQTAPQVGYGETADVTVTVERDSPGEWWVTVRDRGIGMALETVLQYFLKVGASYRHSDVWRTRFEDDLGKARVLRSGRFGVGVLASFLLGDRIEVATRHVDSAPSDGLTFSTTLDEDHIEIRRVPLPIGTTIRVHVRKALATSMQKWFVEGASRWKSKHGWDDEPTLGKYLALDGYCLRDPAVERVILPGGAKAEQLCFLSSPGETVPPWWRVVQHPDYEEIHWTYHKAPGLVCNGVIVREGDRDSLGELWWKDWEDEILDPPNVSVFDPDGKLPLVLQRTGVGRTRCPYSQVVLEDALRDFIAFLLVRGPTESSIGALCPPSVGKLAYPGLRRGNSVAPWFLTATGYGPLLVENLVAAGITRLFILESPSRTAGAHDGLALRRDEATTSTFLASYSTRANAMDDWLRLALLSERHSYGGENLLRLLASLRVSKRSTILRRDVVERYDRLKKKPLPATTHRAISRPWASNAWISFCLNGGEELDPVLVAWAEAHGDCDARGGAEGLALWETESRQSPRKDMRLSRMWDEIVGAPVIPYDHKARARELAHAFRTLKSNVETQEELVRLERREESARKRAT